MLSAPQSRYRLGLMELPPAALVAGIGAGRFDVVEVRPDGPDPEGIDALVVGWDRRIAPMVRQLRSRTYRGAVIAALPDLSPQAAAFALSSGCDDAQRLPIDARELELRIAAIHRRIAHGRAADGTLVAGRLRIGRDGSDPRLDGIPLKVSPNCAKVLSIVAASSVPVPAARIAHALYGADQPPSKTINTYLCMLRSILEAATDEAGWLAFQEGGYILKRQAAPPVPRR